MPLERGLNVMLLQVLPDDPRDDANGHAPLHIQAGDGKGHIIFLQVMKLKNYVIWCPK